MCCAHGQLEVAAAVAIITASSSNTTFRCISGSESINFSIIIIIIIFFNLGDRGEEDFSYPGSKCLKDRKNIFMQKKDIQYSSCIKIRTVIQIGAYVSISICIINNTFFHKE